MPWATPIGLPAGREHGAVPPPEGEPRRLVVRSARAGDAERLAELIRGLSPEARFHRFHVGIPELPASMLDRFVTYDRRVELVLVATTLDAGREIIVAEARHAPVRDGENTHDFALVVHPMGGGYRVPTSMSVVLQSNAPGDLRIVPANVPATGWVEGFTFVSTDTAPRMADQP